MRCHLSLFCTLAVLGVAAPAPAAEDDEPVETAPPAAEPPPAEAPPAEPPPAPPPRTLPAATQPAPPTPYWSAPPPATPPSAPPDADQPAEPELPDEGIVIPRWQIAAGVRTAFVTDEGYDPFSEDNRMMQFSIGGGRTLLSSGAFSIAAAAYYDVSSHSASARGETTELDVHRLSLGPELRAHVLPMLYAFARLSPAVLRTIGRLDESTTNTTLYARSWTFGFDATAGVAFRAISFGRGESATRLWLIGEGGYGWSSSSDLRFAKDEDDSTAPERVADVDLGTLAVRGPMFRILAAVTF